MIRKLIGVQLFLGTAILVLAAIGYAGERDALVVVAVLLVGSVGLSQVLPALVSLLLLRRDRTGAALLISGNAAFVPGVMIVFLTLTSNPGGQALCCPSYPPKISFANILSMRADSISCF